jgi:polysaccharide export outer membrane protein
MKIRRSQRIVSLIVVLSCGSGQICADTPPWWDNAQGKQTAPANDSSEPQTARTGTTAKGDAAPVLEEYTINVKPAETVDERARQQPVIAPANPTPAAPEGDDASRYAVQPGDVLIVSVWHEPDLTREVRVSPDGWINYPLVGEVAVEGATVESLRETLQTKLHKYINEAVVDVSVKEPAGNRIYVLGKVNRPGVYPFNKSIDVVQALSLAGGTSKFAAINDIKILRRIDGEQQTYKFRYSDVERGRSLDQNIVLRSGDVVVVP